MTDAQLGWEVALCAEVVVSAIVDATLVLLSGGKDKESMARMHATLADIQELEAKMRAEREAERGR